MLPQLSPHFNAAEFRCHCCGVYVVNPALLQALEELRNLMDLSLTITSGFRCPIHNQSIGGAKDSYHQSGLAADIKATDYNPAFLLPAVEAIRKFHDGGIGLYSDGFIHVDIRTTQARWCRIEGVYRPIENFTRWITNRPLTL